MSTTSKLQISGQSSRSCFKTLRIPDTNSASSNIELYLTAYRASYRHRPSSGCEYATQRHAAQTLRKRFILFDPVVITLVFLRPTLVGFVCTTVAVPPKCTMQMFELRPIEALHHSFLGGGHGLLTPVFEVKGEPQCLRHQSTKAGSPKIFSQDSRQLGPRALGAVRDGQNNKTSTNTSCRLSTGSFI